MDNVDNIETSYQTQKKNRTHRKATCLAESRSEVEVCEKRIGAHVLQRGFSFVSFGPYRKKVSFIYRGFIPSIHQISVSPVETDLYDILGVSPDATEGLST